jgi:hypothetical protein
MKKTTKLLIAILTVAFIASFHQNVKAQAFQNGNVVANAGLGFGWYGYGHSVTSFPALSLSVEKGIKDLDFGVLSVGGIMGYKHATYNWRTSYDWSWTDFIIAARGAVHADLFKEEKLDTYGGLGVGLRFETERYYDFVYPYGINDYKKVNHNYVHPLVSLYVGARYYITPQLAGFGEIGYGLGYLTLGLSYKFN